MNTKSMLCAVFAAGILATSCTMDEKVQVGGDEIIEENPQMACVPGMVNIKVSRELAAQLEAGTDQEGKVRSFGVKSADDRLSPIGINYMRRTFPPAGKFEERTRREGLHLWYNVYFDESMALTKAGGLLSGIDGVEKVEYRPQIRRSEYSRATEAEIRSIEARKPAAEKIKDIFDDPYSGDQWHYLNNGVDGGEHLIAGCDIDVLPVWEQGYVGSDEVIVAVVDGGVDTSHKDLMDNIWTNEAELNGYGGVDDDGNGYVDDVHGYNFVMYYGYVSPDSHGTHVAGTIAAVNNNGIGVCGIAGGNHAAGIKGVKIMSAQMFDGDYSGDHVEAIKYAADNGAVICQNSWGYNDVLDEMPELDKEAMDYFIKYAGCDNAGNQIGPMKGGVIVFAAGNETRDSSYPAQYEPIVAVSSVGGDYMLAYYSNFGKWVDVAAPGGDANKNNYVLSTDIHGKYCYMQGTSMACPHTSGVVALIVSKYKGMGLTNDFVKEQLKNSTKPIDRYNPGFEGRVGTGLINAADVLAAKSPIAPDRISDLEASGIGANVELQFSVPRDKDNVRLLKYNIFFGTEEFSSDVNVDNMSPEVNCLTIGAGNLSVGDKFRYVLTSDYVDPTTTYYIGVSAVDKDGNESEMSNVVMVTTQENRPPYFEPAEDVEVTLSKSEKRTIRVKVVDPDMDRCSLSLKGEKQNVISFIDREDGNCDIVINGAGSNAGRDYRAELIARDAFGAEASLSIHAMVEDYYNPDRIDDFAAESRGRYLAVSFTVPGDGDNGQPESYDIYLSETEFDPEHVPSDVRIIRVDGGGIEAGRHFEHVLSDYRLEYLHEYFLSAVAIDRDGHESMMSDVDGVYIKENKPPHFEPDEDIQVVLKPNEVREILLQTEDPEGDDYTLEVEGDKTVIEVDQLSQGKVRITLDAVKGEQGGTYVSKLRIKDEYGLHSLLTVKVLIDVNHVPSLMNPIADENFDKPSETHYVDISKVFNDIDGDELEFFVSVSPDKVVSAEVEGLFLKLVSLSSGAAQVTLMAQDPLGEIAETSFKAVVRGAMEEGRALRVAPNPVVDFAELTVYENLKQAQIILYNAFGASVFQKEKVDLLAYEPYRLDMSGFSSGVYVVKILHKGGELSETIIKL